METDEQFGLQIRTALHAEMCDISPSGELIDRLRSTPAPSSRGGRALNRRRVSHILAVGASGAVSVAVASVAIVGLGSRTHNASPAPQPSQGSAHATKAGTIRSLLAHYAILRRPQTAQDRVPFPGVLGFGVPGTLHGRPINIALSMTDLPQYTRVARAGGVPITFYLFRMTRLASDPPAARILPAFGRIPRYSLWVRTYKSVGMRPVAGLGVISQITTISLNAHLTIGIVPDGGVQARVAWPVLFDPHTLGFDPPYLRTVPVHDNVFATPAPRHWPPASIALLNRQGVTVARATDTSAAANQYGQIVSTPAAPTPQSRAAERDPSTPNRIVVLPKLTTYLLARTLRSGVTEWVLFHVLLNHRSYHATITAPHPGCAAPSPRSLTGTQATSTIRGDTFRARLPKITCTGTYQVALAVLDNQGHPYRPFGTTTFTIH